MGISKTARALMVAVVLVAVAAYVRASATYNCQVSGREAPSPGSNGQRILDLKTSGDITGTARMTVGVTDGAVTSGDISVAETVNDAEGNPSEIGTLTGTVSGGTATTNADGTIVSVQNAAITITGGTGVRDTVTSGSGTFSGSVDASQGNALSGTLKLAF